jgi:hypothetical protein
MTENRNGECCNDHDHREQSQQGSPIPVGAIEETFPSTARPQRASSASLPRLTRTLRSHSPKLWFAMPKN